eukprot:gene4291-5429_t
MWDLCNSRKGFLGVSHENVTFYETYRDTRASVILGELKRVEAARGAKADWDAASKPFPYEQGTHPFAQYLELMVCSLRGELQLCGQALPTGAQ